MKLIDGKLIGGQIKDEIANKVRKLIDNDQRPPHLAAILVGHDGASETYVASKEKACKEVGFNSSIYRLEEEISEEKLLEIIEFLNNDDEIDGFIVQLPLPKHINVQKVLNSIDPSKDVDGFHPNNVGNMVLGQDTFLPATPFGIMELIQRYQIETKGKHCVVLGRSNIVGTPVSLLMSRNMDTANATVTVCHSKTKNVEEICRQADIIIAAVGVPHFVKENMVKEGAVVIDVGIHRIPDSSKPKGYYVTGDVDFENVSKKCAAISPVPGGVGPMTIIGLLLNTYKAYENRQHHHHDCDCH